LLQLVVEVGLDLTISPVLEVLAAAVLETVWAPLAVLAYQGKDLQAAPAQLTTTILAAAAALEMLEEMQ
jgi:hypothetical protein